MQRVERHSPYLEFRVPLQGCRYVAFGRRRQRVTANFGLGKRNAVDQQVPTTHDAACCRECGSDEDEPGFSFLSRDADFKSRMAAQRGVDLDVTKL